MFRQTGQLIHAENKVCVCSASPQNVYFKTFSVKSLSSPDVPVGVGPVILTDGLTVVSDLIFRLSDCLPAPDQQRELSQGRLGPAPARTLRR